MTDRFAPIVRGLVGLGIAACIVTAAIIRPAALPPEVRSAWLPGAGERADTQTAQKTHVAGRTFAIDTVTIGSRALPYHDQPYAIVRGAPLELRGWAFDPLLHRTADHVAFRVDRGSWNDAAYQIARPDVATALNEPHVADCGFLVTVPTTGLAKGRHAIEIATVTGGSPNPLPADVRVILSAR